MSRGLARAPARLTAALLVSIVAGCAQAPASTEAEAPMAPWDEPVADARAVTEWRDDGQPVGPFGPDGPGWASPDELLQAMARSLAAIGEINTTAGLVGRDSSGTFVGGIRMEFLGRDGNVLAGDLGVDMRNDGGPWIVAKVRSREHCAVALVAGACP